MTLLSDFHGDILSVNAYFLGQRIRVKAIPGVSPTSSRAYVLRPETGGIVYIFRYGAVILFGMDEAEEADLLENVIGPHILQPLDRPEEEDISLVINPDAPDTVSFDHISIREASPERLEVISDIVAKSAVLSHYERVASNIFDMLEPMTSNLQGGRYPSSGRPGAYLKHIGMALAMQRKMIGQVEIGDRPETLWEQPPELGRFYSRLEDEYEILDRQSALKEKLEVIHHTAETLVNLTQARQTLRVEWYIVGLILFEIVLNLYEKF
jgi:required for meiotic nuclear division protein 1